MSKHNKIGIKGEQIAKDYLLNKGYIIIHTNWRSGRKEVDIIAGKQDMVIFVEIKTRSGDRLLYPEEAVTSSKQNHLRAAATDFLQANPQYRNLRFDIISIIMTGDAVREIVHFEEAFY
jgi:putative endonuclease